MSSPWAMGWDAIAALATAAAAVVAVAIWQRDKRLARRSRADRVTASVETGSGSARLVIRNGADAPAYDINVRHPDSEAQPLLVALVPPGGEYSVPSTEDVIAPGMADSTYLELHFTMDERRWHKDTLGRLNGGRRDKRDQPDPQLGTPRKR